MENLGFINGKIAQTFDAGCGRITIFMSTNGIPRAILVDDGLEMKEFEFDKNNGQVRKGRRINLVPD